MEGVRGRSIRTFGEGEQAYTEVYQHLSGIPRDLVSQVGELVAARKETRKGATKREIYAEAVEDLLAAIRRGDEIEVLATARSGVPVHFWLLDTLDEELTQICEDLDRRKSVVFTTALDRWLQRWNAKQRL